MSWVWDVVQSCQISTLQEKVGNLEKTVAELREWIKTIEAMRLQGNNVVETLIPRIQTRLTDIEHRLDALEGRRGKRLID